MISGIFEPSEDNVQPINSDVLSSPVYRETLDNAMSSENEEGQLFYFKPNCHPNRPLEVCYNKLLGSLVVSCAFCHKPVANVAVAKQEI